MEKETPRVEEEQQGGKMHTEGTGGLMLGKYTVFYIVTVARRTQKVDEGVTFRVAVTEGT